MLRITQKTLVARIILSEVELSYLQSFCLTRQRFILDYALSVLSHYFKGSIDYLLGHTKHKRMSHIKTPPPAINIITNKILSKLLH